MTLLCSCRSSAMAFKMQQKRAAAVLAVFLLGCFASVQARVNQMGELKILAIGDSITQGSVPSKGANHPYTIQLKNILQSKYPGMNIVIDNQGMERLSVVLQQRLCRVYLWRCGDMTTICHDSALGMLASCLFCASMQTSAASNRHSKATLTLLPACLCPPPSAPAS